MHGFAYFELQSDPLRLFCSVEGVERVREPRFPATLLIKPVSFKFQVRYDGHGQ
jgi:hypothetical protein